jgi:hypothetical protein
LLLVAVVAAVDGVAAVDVVFAHCFRLLASHQ